jgi:hypothetical protein
MQSEKACDKEDHYDDADDVEDVHDVLQVRHARFQHESTALQQQTSRSAVKFLRPVKSFGGKVVNFIQTDVASGDTIDSTRGTQ